MLSKIALAAATIAALILGTSAIGPTAARAAETLVVSPATLPSTTVYQSFSTTFIASGGTAPYAFALTSGQLPPGLALASSGQLTGAPTAAGTYSFTVTATDLAGDTGARSYSFSVVPPTLTIAPAILPSPQLGVPYSQTLTTTGGLAPYTFGVSSGMLPPGLVLNSSGTISGTPQAPGTYAFMVRASDSSVGPQAPFTALAAYSLLVGSSIPIITGVSPDTGNSGTLVVISGSGFAGATLVQFGSTQATFVVENDSTISATVPALTAGSYNVSVTTLWGTGNLTAAYTVLAPLVFLGGSLGAGHVGTPYGSVLSAIGGRAPYTFSLSPDNELPAGLQLATNGTITGTPTTPQDGSFQAMVTDSAGNIATATFSLTVYSTTIQATPTVTAGDSVAVSAQDFEPGTYDLELHSDPIPLGSVTVGDDGVLNIDAAIPASTPPGEHELVLLLDGGVVATAPLTVLAAVIPPGPTPVPSPTPGPDPRTINVVAGQTASESLAATGSTQAPWGVAAGAVALLLAGAAAFGSRRLRTRR